MQKYILF